MGLEPVAECRPQHARGRACRATFHDEVFTIEEIGRIAAIERKRLESRERSEHTGRPLPAVAQHTLHAERTLSARMRIHRDRIPALEIEIPAACAGSFIPPRVESVPFVGRTVRSALPLLFRGEPLACP